MPKIRRTSDAYGHELWAYMTEGHSVEIVERDDGLLATNDGPRRYFADFAAWTSREKRAMRFATGSRALMWDAARDASRFTLSAKG